MKKRVKYKGYTIEYWRYGGIHSWSAFMPPEDVGYDYHETDKHWKNPEGLAYHSSLICGEHLDDDHGLMMCRDWVNKRRNNIKTLLLNIIKKIEIENEKNRKGM